MCSSNNRHDAYQAAEQRIKSRYGHIIEFDSAANKLLAMHIHRFLEDMQRLLPLLKGIEQGKPDDNEFVKALFTLRVRLGHLIDHLKDLHEGLGDDEDGLLSTLEPEVESPAGEELTAEEKRALLLYQEEKRIFEEYMEMM